MAGRAFGKTRTAAEWIKERVDSGAQNIALVGATAHDVRVVMVEGESGVLRVMGTRARFESSKRQVRFDTGAVADLHYSTEPESLRGPTYDTAWCDEPAKWSVVGDLNATHDNLMMTLRGGTDPRAIYTTTPLPLTLLREMLKDPNVAVSRGTTYDNSTNLPKGYYAGILKKYEGTRLGMQELLGEILAIEGALFKPQWFKHEPCAAIRDLVVVAIDPAITARHDETGIVVVTRGKDRKGYVLEDCSLRGSPDEWCRAAIRAYVKHRADLIIAEQNRGGDMIEKCLRDTARELGVAIQYHDVRAWKGKGLRAEHAAALYEQGRIIHCETFKALEDQMTTWNPNEATAKKAKSPDRLDALVWALIELFGEDTITEYESIRIRSRRA